MSEINYLIDYLLEEKQETLDYTGFDLFRLYRGLVNTRNPRDIDKEFLNVQDKYLTKLIKEKGIIDYRNTKPIKDNIYLIKGDITTLNTDCIVNAGNKYLLGCFVPCHGCIDNAIHTYSGVQLRNECYKHMESIKEVPNGYILVTDAYNLPSKKIIHTVGPIVQYKPTFENIKDLKKCYNEVLKAAVDNNMKSIAICCISTGEFCYPNEDAAIIAVNIIKEFVKTNDIDVVINVFKEIDYEIYKGLLNN